MILNSKTYKCSQGHVFSEITHVFYKDNICPECWQYAEEVSGFKINHGELEANSLQGLNKDHPWFGKDVFSETVKHVFPKEGEIIEEWDGSQ